MKYFLRFSTLLLGIAVGASAVFVYQSIKARRLNVRQNAGRNMPEPVWPPVDSIAEITLERTGCYSLCPAYKVVLSSDETATYVGKEKVKQKGKYKGKVYGEDFYHLADLIEPHGYLDVKTGNEEPACVESPHVITSFLLGDGRRKTIEIDDCTYTESAKLWGLWAAIDGVAAKIDWQPDK